MEVKKNNYYNILENSLKNVTGIIATGRFI